MPEKLDTHHYQLHPKITLCAHDFEFSGTTTFSGTATFTGDLNLGDLSADTLTVNATAEFTSDVTLTLGSTEALTLTCTDISAPLVMTNTMSTAGKTGCRALFNVKANVALGSYCNAVKGYMEFTGTSGRSTGLASGVCAELKMPNATLASGWYFPLEIEYVAGGTSTTTAGASNNNAGFLFMSSSGDADGDFDDNGKFVSAVGLTAGSGHLLSANSQTLKSDVGASTASISTRYFVLSTVEDVVALAGANPFQFVDSGGKISAAATGSTLYGGGTNGDYLTLQGASTQAGQKITITGGSGTTVTGGLTMNSTDKLYFSDTAMYIRSSADGHLEVVADDTITLSVGGSGPGGIVFGGETDWGTGATGPDLDGTGFDWVTQTVGRVNTENITASAYAAAYHALTVTASQNLTSSFFGTWTELYISASVDLTGASNVAAVWGQVECGATVTGSDQADGDFMAAGYFNFIAGNTFTTGCNVNGIRVQSEVNTTDFTQTASSSFAGIEVLRKATKQPWTSGVKVNMDGATTGFVTSGTSASASGRAAKFAGTVSAAAHGDGYGLVEAELTLTGTQADHTAAFTAWVNTNAGDQGNGGLQICAQNNGIYEGGSGSITDAVCIFGMKMQYVATSTDAGGIYPFALNVSTADNKPTAIFKIGTAVGELNQTGDASDNSAKKTGVVPLYDANGTIGYINIYSANS